MTRQGGEMDVQSQLPEEWQGQADVVVVGYGCAGATAAITAHDLGAGVLLLEKAPRGQEGGNTRVAGQGYLTPSAPEKAMRYLKALCGPYAIPDDMIRVWAEETCQNNDWFKSIGGDPQEHQHQPVGIEFPEFPGSDSVHKFHHGPVVGYSETWKVFERAVEGRQINILYETPGRQLIQNPITKEILGVRAEQKGRPFYVKAKRAVVLTCGGFENNQEMIRTFLPDLPCCYPLGTPYNEGDGVTMAMEVGADLWHMNNFAGPSLALKVPEFRAAFSLVPLNFASARPGGMIVVGADGRRFSDEKHKTSHGKIKVSGRWTHLPVPCPMFMVFDHTLFSAGPLHDKEPRHNWNPIVEAYGWSADNSIELAKGWIQRADSLEALAGQIGHDPAVLLETVNRWNASCASGKDTEFGRTKMLAPIERAPYYTLELVPAMLNTQGGPRRNTKSQIVRPDGRPIPRLYSAGELGSLYSFLYQGTGNIGECMAFGRIAGRNAAAEPSWA